MDDDRIGAVQARLARHAVERAGLDAARVWWHCFQLGGEAGMLEFSYTHPRTGADLRIHQAVRVPRGLPFDLRIGERVVLVCWGVMPSGMLRPSGAAQLLRRRPRRRHIGSWNARTRKTAI